MVGCGRNPKSEKGGGGARSWRSRLLIRQRTKIRVAGGTGSRRYGAGPAIDAWTHWLTPTTREATTPRIVGLSNYHQHRDEHQVATLTRLKRKPKS